MIKFFVESAGGRQDILAGDYGKYRTHEMKSMTVIMLNVIVMSLRLCIIF